MNQMSSRGGGGGGGGVNSVLRGLSFLNKFCDEFFLLLPLNQSCVCNQFSGENPHPLWNFKLPSMGRYGHCLEPCKGIFKEAEISKHTTCTFKNA